MDEKQSNHLKAYGIMYWALSVGYEGYWLLNYRGGSFLLPADKEIATRCMTRTVDYEILTDAQVTSIFDYIAREDINMDKVKLVKAPKIAVYAPKVLFQPWDDAVVLALDYAEIPYTKIYDEEILQGELSKYEWLHLHHEDFTGQYGKFWASYQNAAWYQAEVRYSLQQAQKFGFRKVSEMKLAVAKAIKQYVFDGGFLFAMCSGTDTYDIALSADGLDICQPQFDGDGVTPNVQELLKYDNCLAFQNYTISLNPYEYEHSNIDVTNYRRVKQDDDYFILFDFSAKWDQIPTMLCQNHTKIIKGFMGQTTAFNKNFIKPNVIILGENPTANEAKYIHGYYGQGFWTFYGGHDPEDYQHLVGDPPTDLALYPNSPGYRLILNNVLFPSAKRKKLKT